MGAPFGRTLVQWSRATTPRNTDHPAGHRHHHQQRQRGRLHRRRPPRRALRRHTHLSGDFIRCHPFPRRHRRLQLHRFRRRRHHRRPNGRRRPELRYQMEPLPRLAAHADRPVQSRGHLQRQQNLHRSSAWQLHRRPRRGFQPVTNGPVSNYGSVGTYSLEFSQSILLLDRFPRSRCPASSLRASRHRLRAGHRERRHAHQRPVLNYQRAGDTNPTVVTLTGGTGGLYTGILPRSTAATTRLLALRRRPDRRRDHQPRERTYQATVGEGISVADNGETDIGWTVSGNARGTVGPRRSPDNDRSDPPADYDGSGQCWQTGLIDNEPNSDVDGGETILTSPSSTSPPAALSATPTG